MIQGRSKLHFGKYDYASCLGFCAYAGTALLLPVMLPSVARDLGFPLEAGKQGAGGALHLFRSIAMMIMMLSASFIASRFGKRIATAAALIVIGLGISLTSVSAGYFTLMGAVMFSSLGQGIFEVMVTPVTQDLHNGEDAPRYINITHSCWPIGVVCSVLLAGWALGCGVPWRLIALCCGMLSIIPGIIFLTPSRKQSIAPADRCPPTQTLGKMKSILSIPSFWLFLGAMFFIGGAEHCLNFWMPTYVQMQFGTGGLVGACGPAIFATGMALGRLAVGVLSNGKNLKQIMVIGVISGLLIAAACPFVNTLWMLYILLALTGFFCGPVWPSLHSICAESIRQDRTVMFILLPCVGIPGCGFFPWLMGTIADHAGLQHSFLMIPICLLILLILLMCVNSRKSTPVK